MFPVDIFRKRNVVMELIPSCLKKSDFSYNHADFPSITFPNIPNYLVLPMSFYTAQQMKAFKSMEAYNFFVSGWVKDVGSKILKKKSRLVYARVRHGSIIHFCQKDVNMTSLANPPSTLTKMSGPRSIYFAQLYLIFHQSSFPTTIMQGHCSCLIILWL